MFSSREASLDALLHRRRPSVWSKFLSHPVLFLAQKIYGWHSIHVSFVEPLSPITVVCISDTHNCSLSEIHSTLDWLNRQPHRYKIIIAGNHELILDNSFASHPNCRQDIRWGDVIYLQNESITIKCWHDRNIKIYGSPWTPKHGNWAFQYSRTTDIWHGIIPADIDILITHVPPRGHLDLNGLGCKFLLGELWRLQRKPCLHVFGHVHEGYGIERSRFDRVQRAYDNVVSSEGGFLGLLWFLCLLYTFLSTLHDARRSMTTTWFVNASIVGGLRDEKRRQPIIVHI